MNAMKYAYETLSAAENKESPDPVTDLTAMAFDETELDLMFALVMHALYAAEGSVDPTMRWAKPHLEILADRLKRTA